MSPCFKMAMPMNLVKKCRKVLFVTKLSRSRYRPLRLCSGQWSRHFSTEESDKYDLIVIGGGSGGLACSKEAADLGKNVAVLDYVSPSTQGTKWGLGGTCVNVGCIPKKIMHRASLLKEDIADARVYGWSVPETLNINWQQLQTAVRGYVKSLNWGHRVQLQSKHVTYVNARGSLKDEHTVIATSDDGQQTEMKGDNIVLAVGGRPYIPHEVPGMSEHSITSDDIFWMDNPPGKTLVIGASYVALECAGFMTGFGYNTTVMVRSVPLRGFDRQMSELISNDMESKGTRFLRGCRPVRVERVESGLQVTYDDKDGVSCTEVFDTVLTATGRKSQTSKLGLNNTNVRVDEKSGKILGGVGGEHERTAVPHIYAIGDILQGGLELTPVAVKAGKLLARRLFDNSSQMMHYDRVPTTIFTPLEYSYVGWTEEGAVEKFGHDNLQIYHAFYTPLSYTAQNRSSDNCYIKVICERHNDEHVLGFHMTGPDVGEVTQGFATALMSGARWLDFQNTLGIHPTCAEEVVKLHITKRSGVDPRVTGC